MVWAAFSVWGALANNETYVAMTTENKPEFGATISGVLARLGISERDLARFLKAARVDVDSQRADWPLTSPGLSAREIQVLRAGGARGLDKDSNSEPDKRFASLLSLVQECKVLTEEALDTEAVARLLQVSSIEVERMVQSNPPLLHGFESEPSEWLFPAWQFTDGDLIPHLPHLLSVAESRKPLILRRFMLYPSCDLEAGGKLLSPKDWLVAGYDPDIVFHLATFMTSD